MTQQMNHLSTLHHPVSYDCHDFLQHVCDTSLDAIIIYDDTGRIRSMNRTAESLFGYDNEAIVGESINLILPDIGLLSPENDYLTYMTQGQTVEGQTLHIELMLTEFFDDTEQYQLAIVRDMSQFVASSHHALSPRQKQVLKLVVQGYTSREIAEQLTISIKTVETHRANIMTKLGVRNVSSLVRYAIEQEII